MNPIIEAEINERDAWQDMFAAAPSDWARAHRMYSRRVGSMLAIALADLPTPQFNRAWGCAIDAPLMGDDIARLEEFFRAAGSRTWMIQPAPTAFAAGSEACLADAGYQRLPMRWVKVHRSLTPLTVDARPGLQVREIAAAEAPLFAEPIVRGMGMPPWVQPWVESLVRRNGWRCYSATLDGAPVAGASMYRHDSRAWFGMATTLTENRGRGAQRNLLATRINDALATGASFLSVETGEPMPGVASPSYHNLLACGFEPIAWRNNWIKQA